MKTNVASAIAAAFTAAVILIGSPITTRANGGTNKVSPVDKQVSVQYEGNTDNRLAFKVEFNNLKADKFWLIIKNDNGDVVYHHQFTDAHFAKEVCFENTDSEIQPTFIIRTSDNKEIVRQFQVNKAIYEQTVVTRL